MRPSAVLRALSLVAITSAACFGEAGTVAESDTGEDCPAGALGCACDAGACSTNQLECEPVLQLCIPTDCQPGRLNCPCDTGDTCDAPLACEAGLCTLPAASTSGGSADATSTEGADADTDAADATTTASADDGDSGSSSSGGQPLGNHVHLYFGSDVPNGVFGAKTPALTREAVDADCETAWEGPEPCSAFRAILSIDTADTVADIDRPRYPVVGPTEIEIAPTFDYMVGIGPNTLTHTLHEAGVAEVPGEGYWTGSTTAGALEANNCESWTTTNGAEQGRTGSADAPASGWLQGQTRVCLTEEPRPILCSCVVEAPGR